MIWRGGGENGCVFEDDICRHFSFSLRFKIKFLFYRSKLVIFVAGVFWFPKVFQIWSVWSKYLKFIFGVQRKFPIYVFGAD